MGIIEIANSVSKLIPAFEELELMVPYRNSKRFSSATSLFSSWWKQSAMPVCSFQTGTTQSWPTIVHINNECVGNCYPKFTVVFISCGRSQTRNLVRSIPRYYMLSN